MNQITIHYQKGFKPSVEQKKQDAKMANDFVSKCMSVGEPEHMARECYHQRVKAKLSHREAASRLGLTPHMLDDMEWGRIDIPVQTQEGMDRLYGGKIL